MAIVLHNLFNFSLLSTDRICKPSLQTSVLPDSDNWGREIGIFPSPNAGSFSRLVPIMSRKGTRWHKKRQQAVGQGAISDCHPFPPSRLRSLISLSVARITVLMSRRKSPLAAPQRPADTIPAAS